MKRFLFVATISAILLGFVAGPFAYAAETEMTQQHIDRIRANCVEAKTILQRVHVSDALLRVNRGQLYEQMSTKLMEPLNNRITLNRLDGMTLALTATDYERQLNTFRQSYKTYDETMSDAISINCVDKPVSFYDLVVSARQKRKDVHKATLELHKTIKQYGVDFNAFEKYVKERAG